ncbi:MAG: DNA polymerase III subunit gamma/tau [Campylobacterota bacterium]|nr:DNA polymerase III subunit gamma/tau [Campylobacterota bacterium]
MNETSEVLARKYRPNNFQELIGQDSITQTLSLALETKRLSHAYLFSGLRGSGKTSTARIFSKALICDEGPTSNPCGLCPNCTMAQEGRHMDIIEMDAASSRKIDDIRDLIEHTKYKPASAKYKVFIIDEVHMLTKEAFNALLKTLEEPPEYVKFILATTDPLKLPATILSRTQHFRFKKIATHNIVHHLTHILNLENIGSENEALEILARSGSGSLRDTLTLLDQAIIYSKNFVDVHTVTEMLGLVDPKFIADIFNAIFAKDRVKLIEQVELLADYEAEMVIDELIAYLKERLFANDPQFNTLVLERFFRILSDSKSLFAINADGSFVIGLVFFKMLEALRVKEIDQMIESLEREIKRPASVHITPPQSLAKEETPAAIKTPIKTAEAAVQDEVLPELVHVSPHLEMFETLQAKIMDRNAELGRCFNEQISFVSFKNNILTWESCADEVCKTQLRHGYGVIKQFVREIFGFETKITAQACSKKSLPPKEGASKDTPTQAQNTIEPKELEMPQSASMTEDIETGNGSCVTGCDTNDESSKELDGSTILDEPLIKKAAELFEATKITVQSKI